MNGGSNENAPISYRNSISAPARSHTHTHILGIAPNEKLLKYRVNLYNTNVKILNTLRHAGLLLLCSALSPYRVKSINSDFSAIINRTLAHTAHCAPEFILSSRDHAPHVRARRLSRPVPLGVAPTSIAVASYITIYYCAGWHFAGAVNARSYAPALGRTRDSD